VKTLAECLNMLIRCAGGDGNMLLNVGPMPSGEMAPEQVGRLKEMGAWLTKYGQSIYGTRGGPFRPGRFGVSTRKGRTVYLHIQRWPGETLALPAIPAKIVHGIALTGGAVAIKQTDHVIEVTLPASDRQEIDTVIGLELDRPASAIAPLAALTGSQSLATGKRATASNVYRNMAEFGPGKAFDDNSEQAFP
jgi:alpha-L-fucosidase